MRQTGININQKYRQETRYNYLKNSDFGCCTFAGKERGSETGFSYFGARYYDSDLMTGWLSVDPMADKYPSLSPYAYCGWNPVKLVDPDGKEIHLTFSTYVKGVNTSKELKRIIDGGLGGQFEAIYTKNSNGSYKLSLRATNNGGDITKLTDQQRDFYVELSNIINGEKIAKVDVVYGSRDVAIGSYTNNAIDVADIDQFDNLGEGLCTKQGKLIHELVEQYYKADNGIVKGSDKNYNEAHYYNGIPSENKINRSYRKDLSPIRSKYTQSYTDKKGHKTEYTYNSKDPILKVSKYIKN